MKIVIDIPEKVYSHLKTEYDKVTPEVDTSIIYLMKSIIDGTVLPQEHGDLIDRDKLAYFRCPNNVKNCPLSVEIRGKKHCLKAFGLTECVNCINQKKT